MMCCGVSGGVRLRATTLGYTKEWWLRSSYENLRTSGKQRHAKNLATSGKERDSTGNRPLPAPGEVRSNRSW